MKALELTKALNASTILKDAGYVAILNDDCGLPEIIVKPEGEPRWGGFVEYLYTFAVVKLKVNYITSFQLAVLDKEIRAQATITEF